MFADYFTPDLDRDILAQVRPVMLVYDGNGAEVGCVSNIYVGEARPAWSDSRQGNTLALNMPPTTSATGMVGFITAVEADLPYEMVEAWWQSGFMRVTQMKPSGQQYYVAPNQIEYVDDHCVYLRVPVAWLIKG